MMAKLSKMRFLLHLLACFIGWRLSSASSEWLLAPQQQQPLFNAQQDSYSSFQQKQQQSHDAAAAADGTLVAVTHAQQQHHHHHHLQVPPELEDLEINLEHISLSLRLTCEMNRRLLAGIRSNNNNNNNDSLVLRNAKAHPSNNNPLLQRGGGDDDYSHHPVNVHPSQLWQPPIPSRDDDDQEVLTVFHQKSPRRNKASSSSSVSRRRGVAKWGPELLPYLEYLVDHVLKLPPSQPDRSLILVLSLVYLDRACSVETPRTTTTIGQAAAAAAAGPCPFLQPRTVHRLVLTSLLTAMRAVLGNDASSSSSSLSLIVEESLGISSSQLQQMETQFQRALGDLGLYVDPLQLQQWTMQWQTKFAKKR